MIFLHFSAIACSSSDDSTCAGFMVNCQKMLIQITFKTKVYGKHDLTKEQRKQGDYEHCSVTSSNNLPLFCELR